jgi:hypothetical protein
MGGRAGHREMDGTFVDKKERALFSGRPILYLVSLV